MKQGAKILVTIGFIIVFILLSGVIIGVRQDSGQSGPGFIGLILAAGLIFGIRAIWKYKPETTDNLPEKKENDKHQLDKS